MVHQAYEKEQVDQLGHSPFQTRWIFCLGRGLMYPASISTANPNWGDIFKPVPNLILMNQGWSSPKAASEGHACLHTWITQFVVSIKVPEEPNGALRGSPLTCITCQVVIYLNTTPSQDLPVCPVVNGWVCAKITQPLLFNIPFYRNHPQNSYPSPIVNKLSLWLTVAHGSQKE